MGLLLVFKLFTLCIFCYTVSGMPSVSQYPSRLSDHKDWAKMLKQINIAENGRDFTMDNLGVFERILYANAKARGAYGRSGDSVILDQGDIALTPNQVGRAAAKVVRLWEPNKLAYFVDYKLRSVAGKIKKAMGEWEKAVPCLGRWNKLSRPQRNVDYVNFFPGGGCYANIGRRGGRQPISLGNGCVHHGIIVHEIGHTMGFWHEQARPDRDSYVTIAWGNIMPGRSSQFQKQSNIDSLGVGYDYDSIMHYGKTAFARRWGLVTIRSPQKIGQRGGLSAKDILQARRLYKCTNTKGCKESSSLRVWCAKAKSLGYCSCVKDKCCNTCRVAQNCSDTNKHCKAWANARYCTRPSYITYMKKNCCKSCKAA